MADLSKLEEQANLLMNNVSGWEIHIATDIIPKRQRIILRGEQNEQRQKQTRCIYPC